MAFDDLKLIFETERRILERRLREFLPARPPHDPDPQGPRKSSHSRRPESPARQSAAKQLGRRRWAGAVTWTASIGVHLLILAWVIPHLPKPEVPKKEPVEFTVTWVPRDVPKEPEPEPPAPVAEEATTPEVVEELPETPPTPVVVEEPPAEPDPTPDPPPEPAPSVAGHDGGGSPSNSKLGARSGEKSEALRIFGGGSETERAVTQGLQWLAEHQEADGSWESAGFTHHCPAGRACGGPGHPEYDVGVTSLALLAFLAAGVTGEDPNPFRKNVSRGLDYLLSTQDGRGCFGARVGNYMYNHAIATFCLGEAALLTDRDDYRKATELGLQFSARTQQPGGGWDYQAARTLRNDLSITGWQVMAIHTARTAEIPYAARMEQRLLRYLRRAVHKTGWSTYSDRGIGAGRGGVSIAAVGLLSKLYMGWSPRSTELNRSAEILVLRPPDPDAASDWSRTYQSSYYWYYATLSLFHMGGKRWEAWNSYIKRELLPLQRKQGHRKGSWDPDPNWIGGSGGRIASTALNLLCFEVYYRYKPLYLKYGLEPEGEAGRRSDRTLEEPR